MKRCPQCLFIYPDSDSVCDFDQSSLVDTAESEIAAITNTPERPVIGDPAATHSRKFEARKSRKALPIAAAMVLTFGMLIFGVYLAFFRQRPKSLSQAAASSVVRNESAVATPSPIPSPTMALSPLPTPESAEATKRSTPTTRTAHSATSNGPVSTSQKPSGVASNAKTVILLTSGGTLVADEVWRTKDGIWYRRDGMVTLLKKNRVKAIVKG